MDGEEFDVDRAREIFNYCKMRPITAEAYGERVRTGTWKNNNDAVIGHNQAPVEDSAAATGAMKFVIGEYGSRTSHPVLKAGGYNYAKIAERLMEIYNCEATRQKNDRMRDDNKLHVAKLREDLGIPLYSSLIQANTNDNGKSVTVQFSYKRDLTPFEAELLIKTLRKLNVIGSREK